MVMTPEPVSDDPPERRSFRRRWAALATVVLVAGLAAAGGWVLYRNSLRPLPPPDGPWPVTGHLSLYLCQEDEDVWENCRKRGAATPQEKRALEAVLRTTPEVRRFRFVSKEEALAIFRSQESSSELLALTTLDDMPESYDSVVGPGDWAALVRRFETLPGVSNVYLFRDNFWWGKADVAITLCSRFDAHCDGRGPASDAEKDAVLDRIHGLPGVDAVYFESRPHALRVIRHIWWSKFDFHDENAPGLNEAFYIKFTTRPAMSEVEKAFQGMPGVATVEEVSAGDL